MKVAAGDIVRPFFGVPSYGDSSNACRFPRTGEAVLRLDPGLDLADNRSVTDRGRLGETFSLSCNLALLLGDTLEEDFGPGGVRFGVEGALGGMGSVGAGGRRISD